jgi:hypothetical protein
MGKHRERVLRKEKRKETEKKRENREQEKI